MNMPSSDYSEYRDYIENFSGTKESLQRLYDDIANKYDDGPEMLRRLDAYNRKYSGMNLH